MVHAVKASGGVRIPARAFFAKCAQAYGVLAIYVFLFGLVEVHPEATQPQLHVSS